MNDQKSETVPSRPRRRDLLMAGVAGLTGMAAGGVTGRFTAPQPVQQHESEPAPTPGPAFPANAFASYAQSGEDLILMAFVNHFKLERPTFLDIGAWEPVVASNTFLLYTRGGRGVLVEPNPALADRIREVRPEDKLLAAGIGITDAADADYFMFNEAQMNTFDPDQVKLITHDPRFKLEKTVKVPLVNINRAVAEHLGGKAPDVLSIDIEGLDLAVLKTLDFTRYRPKMICAETLVATTLKHNPETTPFLTSHGYEVRGMTFANTIYLDRKMLG